MTDLLSGLLSSAVGFIKITIQSQVLHVHAVPPESIDRRLTLKKPQPVVVGRGPVHQWMCPRLNSAITLWFCLPLGFHIHVAL